MASFADGDQTRAGTTTAPVALDQQAFQAEVFALCWAAEALGRAIDLGDSSEHLRIYLRPALQGRRVLPSPPGLTPPAPRPLLWSWIREAFRKIRGSVAEVVLVWIPSHDKPASSWRDVGPITEDIARKGNAVADAAATTRMQELVRGDYQDW